MRHARGRCAVGSVWCAAVLLAGCGDDPAASGPGRISGEAQPAVEGTMFVDGLFDDLPMFRAATPIQRPTEQNGTIAASYETDDARPDTVIDFYRDALAERGWTELAPPAEVGRDVWQGDWVKAGRRLEVSTSPLPSGDVTRTQIDLVLHEDTSVTAVASA